MSTLHSGPKNGNILNVLYRRERILEVEARGNFFARFQILSHQRVGMGAVPRILERTVYNYRVAEP